MESLYPLASSLDGGGAQTWRKKNYFLTTVLKAWCRRRRHCSPHREGWRKLVPSFWSDKERQSIEWHHSWSSKKKKPTVISLVHKTTRNVIWGTDGWILGWSMPQETPVMLLFTFRNPRFFVVHYMTNAQCRWSLWFEKCTSQYSTFCVARQIRRTAGNFHMKSGPNLL